MLFQVYSWQPIDTAPEDQPLWLKVVDKTPERYALPFPCTKKGPEFLTENGHKLGVTPVEWRTYFPRNVRVNPRYTRQANGWTDGVPRTQYANVPED
jgi:hypothetical protein